VFYLSSLSALTFLRAILHQYSNIREVAREMAKKPTILCVDDLEENLRIRLLLLRHFGCDTLTAHDHSTAIRAATDNQTTQSTWL